MSALNPLSTFAQSYLRAQGVVLLPPKRKESRQVEEREKEFVPVVPMYERD